MSETQAPYVTNRDPGEPTADPPSEVERPNRAAIKERWEAASKGLWCSSGHGDILCGIGTEYQRIGQMELDWYGQWRKNGTFIVYAHQDIPALLADIERLQAAGAALWAIVARSAAVANLPEERVAVAAWDEAVAEEGQS